MQTTNFGSVVVSGSGTGDGADAGVAVLAQSITIVAGGVAAQAAVLQFPEDATRIISITADTTVAHTAATITAAIGSTTGGAELVTATSVKDKARANLLTAAKLDVLQAFTGGEFHITLAAGTPTTTGSTTFTVLYALGL